MRSEHGHLQASWNKANKHGWMDKRCFTYNVVLDRQKSLAQIQKHYRGICIYVNWSD